MIGNIAAGLFGTGVAAVTASYESIATVTLSSSQSTVSFTSIPSTYKHLQIRWLAKTDRTEIDDNVLMQFNSDTGSNYSWHFMRGNSSVTLSNAFANTSNIAIQYGATGNSGATNIFGVAVMDILDYGSTSKYKTTRSLQGLDLNGEGWIYLESGNWRSTSAITSITLDQQYSSNFLQYSTFALYGIKD